MNAAPRSVSTMTPAQLARKRALDRASQRATRARAREHIERLEQEVYELRVATAAQSNGVDQNTLQVLHLRNQALRQELARLQRLAAAEQRTSSVYQPKSLEVTSTPMSQYPQGYDTEIRSQWRSQSQTQTQSQLRAHNIYQYNSVPNSSISMDASTVPRVSNTQLARTIHATAAEQQAEWLNPDLWNSSVARFSMPESTMALQAPQQHSPPLSHSFGCTCTQEIISPPTSTPEDQYISQMRSQYTSMGLQQTSLPLDWDSSDTASNTSWQ